VLPSGHKDLKVLHPLWGKTES